MQRSRPPLTDASPDRLPQADVSAPRGGFSSALGKTKAPRRKRVPPARAAKLFRARFMNRCLTRQTSIEEYPPVIQPQCRGEGEIMTDTDTDGTAPVRLYEAISKARADREPTVRERPVEDRAATVREAFPCATHESMFDTSNAD